MDARQLTLLPVAPGAAGAAAVRRALAAAWDGGPAVAPIRTDAAASPPGRPDGTVGAGTAAVIATSGSTGAPQQVELSAGALHAAAQAAHRELAGPGIWLTALPVTGIGGFMTLVRGLVADMPPQVWSGVGGAGPFTADSFAGAIRSARARADAVGVPCYTSLVPTQILRLARGDDLAELAVFDAVLVGGAALSPALAAALDTAGVRFVATYGATETCGGVVFAGRPLPGVSVRIDPAPGHDGSGRIEIGGPTLATGYRDDPAASAAAFPGGWFRSNDLGRWESGRVTVLGRTDDIVKVGGAKVSLAAVADALRGHPAVLDAHVVPHPDEEWGQIPAAYVVADPAAAAAPADLVEQLHRRVAHHTRLHRIELVAELPQTPAGKADRRAVMEG